MEDDLKLLEQRQTKEYARKQCLKICHYLQKVRSIEILKMNVEFHEDDNKNIWFTFASDIQFRDISKKGKLAIGDVDPKTLHKELKASQEA